MIAVSPATRPAEMNPEAPRVSPWQVVACFNTIEAAEPVLHRLRGQGVEAYLTLVGGLSVVARSVCSDSPMTLMQDAVGRARRSDPTSVLRR